MLVYYFAWMLGWFMSPCCAQTIYIPIGLVLPFTMPYSNLSVDSTGVPLPCNMDLYKSNTKLCVHDSVTQAQGLEFLSSVMLAISEINNGVTGMYL